MSSDGPNIGLSKAQRDDVEALVADAQRRSRAADRLATRVGQIPVRTLEVVRASVDTATKLGQSSLTLLSVLLVLFICLLYTSPSPRDQRGSRMPASA